MMAGVSSALMENVESTAKPVWGAETSVAPSISSPLPYYRDTSDNYSTYTTPHHSVGDPAFTTTLFADRMAAAAYANSHTGAPQAALNRLAS